MDSTSHRSWNVLNWNIRGLNADDKQTAIRNKIEESDCSIFCIQETKMSNIDMTMFKKMAPKCFNQFAFVPSCGASRGILMGWNASIFTGQVLSSSNFQITLGFTSMHNANQWNLTTVYGPCQGQEKQNFIDWLYNLQIADDQDWMIVGDFNMYRSTENRNREGGNMTDVFTFNEIISSVGMQEIPLKGKNYTWSNMQEDPLLEQIDWCFTSTHWISAFPNTLMLPLSRPTSEHTPYRIQIGTSIPKAQIFCFENHWIQQPGLSKLVQQVSNINQRANNIASRIAAKFKLLR
jgi:exonuclease III